VRALLLAVLLAGCGYRPEQSCLAARYGTISVPYVDGELAGAVNSALSYELARSPFSYRTSGAALELLVEIEDVSYRARGYRYDRNIEGKLTKLVVTSEEEVVLEANVTLIDALTGCEVIPTTRVTGCIEYDFEPAETRTSQLRLSLGELESCNGAREIARNAATQILAQRIVALLTAAW
jgi:hypothetical protein